MCSTDDVRCVLDGYGLSGQRVLRLESLENAGGWSGSRLWRLQTVDGRKLCLRRWPAEHPDSDRLRLIHATLKQVHAGGLTIVPAPQVTAAGESFVQHAGHSWELTPWMPGKADYRERPTPARLRAAVQALARFHQISGGAATSGPAPALAERQALLAPHLKQNFSQLRAALANTSIPLLEGPLRRILRQLESRGQPLMERLSRAAAIPTLLQPAIRDIHHDHVLFTGDEVTGLVDFGALRIDTPLADVARLVGSLAQDQLDQRQAALAAYSAVRPLQPHDVVLIDLLDESGLVLGGLNWVQWLYVEARDMGPADPIARRLEEILCRLERG